MRDYILTCESTADYPASFFAEREIPYVCFHYEIGGEVFTDDLYASITPAEFFGRLKAGARSITSQPSAGDYASFWEPFLVAGRDVVHLTLSSGISGAYNAACVAARQLAEEHPERTVHVIDSLAASSGYGMLVEHAADLRDQGMGAEGLCTWMEAHRLKLNHWFFVSDLECLKRGGRVSSTSALLASALKICPVLDVDCHGGLTARQKIRTMPRAERELVRMMEVHAEGGTSYDGACCICHSNCLRHAENVRAHVERKFPQLAGRIEIHDIGAVIGSHTGPGTVGLFFMGDMRIDER